MSTRRRRRWSAALALPLVTALLIHPSAAHADSALAEQLFKDGLALMDQGKVAEACDKFAASMDAEPSGGTALNLGRCNEEQGKMASAWAAFERAATLFRSTGESDREAFAEEQAARVAPQLSRLTIAVTKVPGLTVTRNGEPVPEAALGTAVPVDPGEQVIVASAPGYETATATVTVAAGAATAEVTVPPLVASEEPPAPAPGQGSADDGPNALVITGGVLLGVGGVAAIVGGVLGGMVLSDASRARELCNGTDCDGSPQGREGLNLVQSAEDKALVSNVLVIGGSVVGVAGAALLIVGLLQEPGEEPAAAEVQVTPWLGPGLLGGSVGLSF